MTITPYYADEWVTLYHGDCLELADLWTCADVLVTDPPYGIGWTLPALPNSSDGRRGKTAAHAGIKNDATTEVRDEALRRWGLVKPAVIFSAWSALVPNARQTLVWQKPATTGVIGSRYGYRRDTEAIQLIGRHSQRAARRSSVLRTDGSNTDYQDGSHPHMKPVPLLQHLMEWTAGAIADPFAGSGSTLVAAKALGRRAIGIELEERYCEVAARRLAQDVLDFNTPIPTSPHQENELVAAAVNVLPELLDALDAIRAEHFDDGGGRCASCEAFLWPCPTARVLDGLEGL